MYLRLLFVFLLCGALLSAAVPRVCGILMGAPAAVGLQNAQGSRWVHIGEEFDGYAVLEISPDSVWFLDEHNQRLQVSLASPTILEIVTVESVLFDLVGNVQPNLTPVRGGMYYLYAFPPTESMSTFRAIQTRIQSCLPNARVLSETSHFSESHFLVLFVPNNLAQKASLRKSNTD